MEKKQGLFTALKEEVARGLSPGRSRSRSRSRSESPQRNAAAASAEFLPRRRRWWWGQQHQKQFMSGDLALTRCGSLAPLLEGPEPGEGDVGGGSDSRRERRWGQWMMGPLMRAPSFSGNDSAAAAAAAAGAGSCRLSDIRLLLGIMGAPLAPVHVCSADPLPHLSIKDTPIETSSAQYILQQYTAASGGLKLLRSIHNSYAMGKLRMMTAEFETATKTIKNRHASKDAESGGFVLWQMAPEMWYVELAVGGSKVHAGCNGKLVWRHTPWLGAHAAKGPVRPLRRAIQGLDPLTTASMFANARCIGEKNVDGEDCFILKLCADPQTLKARAEGPTEIIRHVLFGYFSQKTGLLVHMEDSHLTRIQSSAGGDAVYWETTISSFIQDYRQVEGVTVAHSGRSVVTLFRFGEVAFSHTKTRMEETWTIEEVAFNVPGLSMDCFIPPADIRCRSISEAHELPHGESGKNITTTTNRAKVAALEKQQITADKTEWKSNG